MIDLRLWRPTHVPVDDMRGIVPDETSYYAIGWMLSALLTLAVVCLVWTFGF